MATSRLFRNSEKSKFPFFKPKSKFFEKNLNLKKKIKFEKKNQNPLERFTSIAEGICKTSVLLVLVDTLFNNCSELS